MTTTHRFGKYMLTNVPLDTEVEKIIEAKTLMTEENLTTMSFGSYEALKKEKEGR